MTNVTDIKDAKKKNIYMQEAIDEYIKERALPDWKILHEICHWQFAPTAAIPEFKKDFPNIAGRKPIELGGCLVIPYHDIGGTPRGFCVYRELYNNRPTFHEEAPLAKLCTAHKAKDPRTHLTVDFCPLSKWENYKHGDRVYICESAAKACCIAYHAGVFAIGLNGVNCGVVNGQLIQGLSDLARAGTRFTIIFDRDSTGDQPNANVIGALIRLHGALESVGAVVDVLYLPEQEGMNNTAGVDDYVRVLGAAWLNEWLATDGSDAPDQEVRYLMDKQGIRDVEYNHLLMLSNIRDVWDIRYNLEKHIPSIGGVPLNDGTAIRILTEMQGRYGLVRATAGRLWNTLESLRSHEDWCVSPIRDWLLHLEWDGKKRLCRWLVDYCGVEDSQYARQIGQNWLTALAGRHITPGAKFDSCMVAVGPGNIGKSSMPRVLLNDPVWEGRVIDHERGMKEADILGAIRKSSIYNFDEISHVTGRLVDREWAKQLLSQVEDTYRAPYARHVNTGPRRCVFYGTSNDTSFLDSDPTGNRRWWPVSFVQVQFEKLAKDSEQLLAEAVYEWENGYQVNVLPEGFHEIVEEFAMEMEEGAVKVLDFMDKSTLRVKIQGATYRYAFLAEAMLSAGYSMGEINHNGWAVKRLVALLKKHGWGKHHVKAGGNQRKAWIKRT